LNPRADNPPSTPQAWLYFGATPGITGVDGRLTVKLNHVILALERMLALVSCKYDMICSITPLDDMAAPSEHPVMTLKT